MSWRTARSLDTILSEINAAAPNRSKRSDGSIGDVAHSSRASDHNPNSRGVVRARDFTHDPAGGLDCIPLAEKLATMLRAGQHPALRSGAYVIFRGRIISRDRIKEGWRHYSGSNPHNHHLHLSVATDPNGYDSTQRWGVMDKPKPPAPPKPKPTIVEASRIRLEVALRNAVKNKRHRRAAAIRAALKALPKR